MATLDLSGAVAGNDVSITYTEQAAAVLVDPAAVFTADGGGADRFGALSLTIGGATAPRTGEY